MAYTALSAASAGQLINASWMNAYVRDNINALNGNGVVPASAIIWWPYDASLRPDNWFACDGTFGVQDLRDRMIVGAGSTYAVHDVGGSTTAPLSAHTAHSIGTSSHAAHTINAASAHGIQTLAIWSFSGAGQIIINTDTHSSGVTEGYSHSGQALTDTHAHSSSPYSVLPPYAALAPILKGTPTLSVGTPRTWADGDVPTAAMFNADIRDAISALRQRMLWANSIILWSGSLAALPSGYQLCNGTNGTPDMRDRFNIGAGTSYAALATGGAATQAIPNHANHVATQPDAHANHAQVTLGAHGSISTGIFAASAESTDVAAHAVTPTGSHGNHSAFAVDAHAVHADIATIPPYIALGYIQLTSPGTYTTPRTWTDGELIDASRINTYVRDNEAALYAGQVPVGGILAWHESIASIPANYAHCNGSGGTSDTRNRFVAGAGLSYAVTATGGAASVTPAAHAAHVVTSPNAHSVSHGITQSPAHALTTDATTNPGSGATNFVGANMSHDFAVAFGGAGEHTHAFTVDGGAAHSAHDAMSLLPPYHALAFIQRVS